MSEIDRLIKERGIIKGTLTRHKNYYEQVKNGEISSRVIGDLDLRLSKIEPLLDNFNEKQQEIECILTDQNYLEEQEQERINFESSYYSLVGDIRECVGSFFASQNAANKANSVSSGVSQKATPFVQLPALKLPTFNGRYDGWVEFRDGFKALVHDNLGLSNVQKFYYLKSSLKDDAFNLIESIHVSDTNYKDAWQLLHDRFEQKALLIHNHIRSIFEYPSIDRENHATLRTFFDNMTKHLRALKALGEETEKWDRLLIYLFCTKLDKATRKEWELYDTEDELPTMEDMNKFLKQRCDLLEKLEVSNNSCSKNLDYKGNKSFEKENKGRHRYNAYTSYQIQTNKQSLSCYYCKERHTIFQCEKFLNLTNIQKSAEVRKLKLCYNCLRPSHEVKDCLHSGCKKCKKRHNTILHVNFDLKQEKNESENQVKEKSGVAACNDNSCDNNNETCLSLLERCAYNNTSVMNQVILPTAMVKLKDSFGNFQECRALLDSGAQSNFMSERMSNSLNVKLDKGNFCVSGVGSATTKIKNKARVKVYSYNETFSTTIECLVIQKITENLPTVSFENQLDIPEKINLADCNFNERREIDLLIGSSVFWDLLCKGKYYVKNSQIVVQETRLGWVVGGVMQFNRFTPDINNIVTCLSLDKMITRFWELEEIGSSKILSESDKMCEQHFSENVQRSKEGKFVVSIPFKDDIRKLGESRERALQYFYSQEARLERNQELKEEYVKFMNEYQELGHMAEVNESANGESVSYYMPHHAVVREDSKTTRVRVVFNASMKTSSGLSLNDVQYVGPTIQDELLAILLRFRKHEYVMTADISKMYRMIFLKQNQRCLQRIFWRENLKDKLKCFELNTVTYGTASAPYLAVRCLHQLANENSDIYPKASESIRTSFYMDDYLEGATSEEELLQLQNDVSIILSSAGFKLRKWLCNQKELCSKFHLNENLDSNIVTIGENEANKTLGIYWNASLDTIQFSVAKIKDQQSITKRNILSIISQIYDPLGLISPIVIIAKLLIQKLWQAKVGWENDVPEDIKVSWLKFRNNLPLLDTLKLSRKVICSKYTSIELHGFGDASQRAYGCCLYVRCKNENDEYTSTLLCSKSRVAPIKQVTLPRLELCAALLLARLAHKVIEHMDIKFDKLYFWSDSQITLSWIQGSPSKWKTFVANRVSEIQQLTDVNNWYHVKSQDNPADLISRGTCVSDLKECKLWWIGPEWLLDNSYEPIQFINNESSNNIPEQKTVVNVAVFENLDICSKYSTLNKLKRIFGYCLRFLWNLKCKTTQSSKRFGILTTEELNNSLNELVKLAQKEAFPIEYNKLVNGFSISKKSSLLSLNPISINNIIRVGGRLQNSNHEIDKKHPIILPKTHILTKLILTDEHQRLMHCGPTLLLSSIRERYWPISGRNSVRKIVRDCLICFKNNPRQGQYLMGNLPESRVNQYLPFYNTGCDFAGPFLIKDRMTRGAKLIKAYVCVFICLATKAIHLEAVSDLTTSCFLACFKRFIGRRGKPLNIYSDNGKNFVGADKELKRLQVFITEQSEREDFNQYFSDQNISWHFIPARAPNFGGIWEAGVKSFKFHFKRIVGEAYLCYEDFNTVLVQIESVLNSRPICPLSPVPDQLNPLTPAHFLLGRSLTSLPEKSYLDVPQNRLKRYQRLQQIIQHFWKRWHQEYLCELQVRSKWKHSIPTSVKVGTLVLISDDNTPPLKWPIGRVHELHPGKDGVVRVVSVKFNKGIFKRPITKLCVFPTENGQDT